MQIAITGATGFVGGSLTRHLRAAGHEVVWLVRAKSGRELPASAEAEVRAYEPLDVERTAAALEGAEAIVNLAGRPVLTPWSDAVKADLRASRIDTTATLVQAIGRQARAPGVLVSASAIGWYGPREPDVDCIESEDRPGEDFLATLCVDWEAEAAQAEAHGTRVVLLRIGLVLGRGGALAQMQTPFKLGLGGRIGSGHQAMSWIHVEDLDRLALHCIEHDAVQGPVNATAPNPVSNRVFTKALGRALKRPTFLPVPAFALRLRFGSAAQVLTSGQRVLPKAALDSGFTFDHPEIDGALGDIYAS